MHKVIKEETGYSYNDKKYRSKEEIYFSWYLDDIRPSTESIEYEPFQIEVIPKRKVQYFTKETKLLVCPFLREFSYTPDFVIVWKKEEVKNNDRLSILWKYYCNRKFNPKHDIFYSVKERPNIEYKSYIEIKGTYSKNNPAGFSLKQKIIYEAKGIYVQKIVPKEFFKAIDYYPKRYLWTDSGKQKRKL